MVRLRDALCNALRGAAMDWSRRIFLAHAGMALTWNAANIRSMHAQQPAAAARRSSAGFDFAHAAAGPDWYGRPMRWAQLAFVEDDPGNYDPAFWLDYFKRIHADAACLSAGGVVAFYPTEVPLHYRSKWLGNADTFGDLVAGCRKQGMNILARTDSHACHQDAYDAHPDWIAVDEHGNKQRHPSDPELWITCALGPYSFVFMNDVHREIMQRYMPDGIFTNRWSGSGMCYCDHCRTSFKAYANLDLPRSANPQDPARHAYSAWRQKTLFEVWDTWNATIRSVNPNASYIANAGGGALSDLDMKHIGELSPTLFADRQARSGLTPPWANGKNAKEYRATMGNKPIGGIFSVGVEERLRWKDSVQSADEIRLWVADGIAQGLRPWFTKFNAKPLDPRWMPVVENIYKWHYANEGYLRNERSLAQVGMVYSQQTATYYGGPEAHSKVEDATLGYYQALVESRIPFDMVHDGLLDEHHLAQYRVLVLPNIAALSDAQCEHLSAFVQRGGGLVATFETSLYNADGVRRQQFGLSSLFGAAYQGGTDRNMLNSYLQLDHAGEAATGLLAGMDDVPRMINAANQVKSTPLTAGYHAAAGIIGSYPDLPMEEVFREKPAATSGPGVYANSQGKGRVVYFPGDVDRTFWETLNPDQGHLLRNAVLWAANQSQPVTVEGKGILDVALWQQRNSITVHLVNLTNPMMMKGPIRELIPSPPQLVKLRIAKAPRRARFLSTGKPATYTFQSGILAIHVPPIELHEVIALDLA
jgi:hypothetical protein